MRGRYGGDYGGYGGMRGRSYMSRDRANYLR